VAKKHNPRAQQNMIGQVMWIRLCESYCMQDDRLLAS